MDKIETENELNYKVTNQTTNQTLIDENCCTLLTISLTNSGDVFTTFLGAYNEEILKLLKRTQKQYYKNLIKKLKASKSKNEPAEVTEEDHHENNEVVNSPNSNKQKSTTVKNSKTKSAQPPQKPVNKTNTTTKTNKSK